MWKKNVHRAPEQRCPFCGGALRGHVMWDLASVELGSSAESELLDLIQRRDWKAAAEYHSANSLADIRVWRVLECSGEDVALVPVVLPIEVWTDDSIGKPEIIAGAEAKRLRELR